MCIRDRLLGKRKRAQKRARVEHGHFADFRDGFAPHRHGEAFRAQAFAAAIRAGYVAVSYTHLDVYKRQDASVAVSTTIAMSARVRSIL